MQQNLAKANKEIEDITLQYQEAQKSLNSTTEQSSHTTQVLDTLVEQKKAMEEKHTQELEEMAKKQQETDAALQASQTSLASREEELQTLRGQAEEQERVLTEARASLQESVERVEKATLAKNKLVEELAEVKELHLSVTVDRDALKASLEARAEVAKSKLKSLETTVEEQKNELNQANLSMQHVRWEKEQLELAKCELRASDRHTQKKMYYGVKVV